ncbi:unnamed protein product (macronuclear) [Paramecium tetraurelia]|uniref:Alpha_tubulin,putative n=1 Tax=Paramecium tetraurelia TaxID=5888 RepID=Q3SEH1_PARTE|nr:uncharacterized protein GSPATT00031345001 [Paramecium tetraurelia]CAI38953.1 alpha_tubulin,putative [Paramecium tetraurelia]CAK61114.1 unnamed protein product [Paramecium tetraurelia]|eukprot:XP_001428512.1 hypothetical protein (macronuclear) [Paramecium tetraurelia strain d4-2]
MSSALHIHVGGAGIKMGDMLWKLYEKEYNETTQKNYIYDEFEGNHYPQAFFVDTDDRMIHEVQRNQSVKFKKHSFFHGTEDASTFARGLCTIGGGIEQQALDCIQKQIETMDRLDEFVITSSISGGTGSGFLSNLVSLLKIYYRKVRCNGFIIFPSSKISNNVVAIYNAVLSMENLMYSFNSITMFDNESMYNFIDRQLDLDFVDYSQLNNLVAQIISAYTGIRRFNSEDNSIFFKNLCPHPRLHFLIPSYSKMTLINDYARKELEQREFIQLLLKKDQKLYQCSTTPNYICTALLFRQKQLNPFYGKLDQALNNLNNYFGQSSQIYQCKSSNYQVLPELAEMKQTGTFFSNDTSIVSSLQALGENFDKYFCKRAFLQYYKPEGLEEREIIKARYDLENLIKQYQKFQQADNQQN